MPKTQTMTAKNIKMQNRDTMKLKFFDLISKC